MKILTLKIILILLLILLGLTCSLLAYDTKIKVSELKTWISMEAEVTSTSITEELRSKGKTYCPDINVSFELFSTKHTSKLQTSQTPCSPFKHSIRKELNTYAAGNTVNVYVNPKKTSEVRLSTFSFGWTFYMNIIIASLSITTAFALPFIINNSTEKPDNKKTKPFFK